MRGNMENYGINRGKRFLLLFTQHCMAVFAAICVAVIICNAYFEVNGITNSYSYTFFPWDGNNSYETSPVFNNVFQTSVDDIITMSVIKTQLETDGKFDGKKKIDIAAYVNRREQGQEQGLSAEYY